METKIMKIIMLLYDNKIIIISITQQFRYFYLNTTV